MKSLFSTMSHDDDVKHFLILKKEDLPLFHVYLFFRRHHPGQYLFFKKKGKTVTTRALISHCEKEHHLERGVTRS